MSSSARAARKAALMLPLIVAYLLVFRSSVFIPLCLKQLYSKQLDVQ